MSKKYVVIYEKGDGEWWAYVPDLLGCTSGGKTQEEAAENVKEAIALWIEGMTEQGAPIPEPTTIAGIVERTA